MEQINQPANMFKKITNEQRHFLDFFILSPMSTQTLIDRFQERTSQAVVGLPSIARHLKNNRLEIALERFKIIKPKLLLFCDFVLSMYEENEDKFAGDYVSDSSYEQTTDKKLVVKTLQQVKDDLNFKKYVEEFKESVKTLECTEDSIESFFSIIKK